MQAVKWSVWHTYSSLFQEAFYDLGAIAQRLVDSGMSPFVYSSRGVACWRTDEGVESGRLVIDMRAHESSGHVGLPRTATEYQAQCALMAGSMRVAERAMLNDSRLVEAQFVRAFLDVIHLHSGEYRVNLYPQIKLYANGVFLLHFVVFSPSGGVPLADMVERYVNLFGVPYDRFDMAPGLINAGESGILTTPDSGRRERREAEKALQQRRSDMEARAEDMTDGDFTFRLTSLARDETLVPPQSTDFDRARVYATAALEWAVNRAGKPLPRSNPEHGRTHHVGSYWHGRPTVYLLEYSGQPEIADIREPSIREAATAILSRTSKAGPHLQQAVLDRDLRLGQDYCLLLNRAVSLFAFSRLGVSSRGEVEDPNYADIIFDKQAFAEAIDYQRLSHVRLAGMSAEPKKNLSEALEERYEYHYLLEWLQPSNYDEVNDILSYAQGIFDLAGMRERILAESAIGKEDYLARRGTWIAALALGVTVVFACGSAPSIASSFVLPVLEHFQWISASPATTTLWVINVLTLLATLAVAVGAGLGFYRRL